jgi:hypothetical protein
LPKFRLLIEWSLVRIQPGEPKSPSLPFFITKTASFVAARKSLRHKGLLVVPGAFGAMQRAG